MVSQVRERIPAGTRVVRGSERLTDVEAMPRIFWSSQEPRTEDDPSVPAGVLVDLDLDDVPATDFEFTAGAVAIDETDVWVMDRSDPVLLHVDTASAPPRVVEYLLPLTVEPTREHWTRVVHADSGGCWITSQYDVFRCDRGEDGSLTVERVCTEGGRSVVDAGRLYLLGPTTPAMHTDPRYGAVRVDPPSHPVRMLDDARKLVGVDDPATAARVRASARRADIARGADGTEWIADGALTARRPSGTDESVDLDARARGHVRWTAPDPYADPADRALVPILQMPIPTSDTTPG